MTLERESDTNTFFLHRADSYDNGDGTQTDGYNDDSDTVIDPLSPACHSEDTPDDAFPEHSRYIALDCEMVGVGSSGLRSLLARVCVVDLFGQILLDVHVRPTEPVTDYRTFVSGVRYGDLTEERGAADADVVRERVRKLIEGKVLVGHALENDLAALGLDHPQGDVRDTARYEPYMAVVCQDFGTSAASWLPSAVSAVPPSSPSSSSSRSQRYGSSSTVLPSSLSYESSIPGTAESDCSSSTSSLEGGTAVHADTLQLAQVQPQLPQLLPHQQQPYHPHSSVRFRPRKLRNLTLDYLGLDIQRPGMEHSPAEDARAAMALYRLARPHWERVVSHEIRSRTVGVTTVTMATGTMVTETVVAVG